MRNGLQESSPASAQSGLRGERTRGFDSPRGQVGFQERLIGSIVFGDWWEKPFVCQRLTQFQDFERSVGSFGGRVIVVSGMVPELSEMIQPLDVGSDHRTDPGFFEQRAELRG